MDSLVMQFDDFEEAPGYSPPASLRFETLSTSIGSSAANAEVAQVELVQQRPPPNGQVQPNEEVTCCFCASDICAVLSLQKKLFCLF